MARRRADHHALRRHRRVGQQRVRVLPRLEHGEVKLQHGEIKLEHGEVLGNSASWPGIESGYGRRGEFQIPEGLNPRILPLRPFSFRRRARSS